LLPNGIVSHRLCLFRHTRHLVPGGVGGTLEPWPGLLKVPSGTIEHLSGTVAPT
jgi:hypothetical protein